MTTVRLMVEALGMKKKEADKRSQKIPCRPNFFKIQITELCITPHFLRNTISKNDYK